MLERLGHPVSKLIRTQYAGLVLGDLSLGKSRLLTAAEVRRLQVAAQGRPAELPASGAAPARRPHVRTAAPVHGRRVREKAVRR
jgi:hypothetical protein